MNLYSLLGLAVIDSKTAGPLILLALTSGQPAALTQAISGLGGVGKTQLAIEYAYRHAAEYDVVWWVRAEETATLAADYAALAGPLNLPQKDAPDQRIVVEAVRRWFTLHTGWLLVLDNAPGPAEVRGYLPGDRVVGLSKLANQNNKLV